MNIDERESASAADRTDKLMNTASEYGEDGLSNARHVSTDRSALLVRLTQSACRPLDIASY